ncbi:hypothetical protein CEXT_507641 [Caerostris extrusa]|uniref:Uncharacterized protein n=1 Tax=Caerostris extrusa TaxID=172846 RepID=A0AAV4TRY5_CAEEX|nr:hypothetical protein CEXT_507641 [Caerostris extrusa]
MTSIGFGSRRAEQVNERFMERSLRQGVGCRYPVKFHISYSKHAAVWNLQGHHPQTTASKGRILLSTSKSIAKFPAGFKQQHALNTKWESLTGYSLPTASRTDIFCRIHESFMDLLISLVSENRCKSLAGENSSLCM